MEQSRRGVGIMGVRKSSLKCCFPRSFLRSYRRRRSWFFMCTFTICFLIIATNNPLKNTQGNECSTLSLIRKRASSAIFGISIETTPICPSITRHSIHVLIPFHGIDPLPAVESVRKQNYDAPVYIWLVQDGGAISSPTLRRSGCRNVASLHKGATYTPHAQHMLRCFVSDLRAGPAASRYKTLKLIRTFAAANDLIVLLDGDDELLGLDSLETINQAYLRSGVWSTYGSYEGLYSEQMHGLTTSTKPFNPRFSGWHFGHPRTFKVHLIDHIFRHDFVKEDGTWLQKATDQALYLRILELCGKTKVLHIPDKIYKYNNNPQSTLKSIPFDQRQNDLAYVHRQDPVSPIHLPLHIILVVYARIFLIPLQIESIASQSLHKHRDLVLHILNNNLEASDEIESIVLEAREKYIGFNILLSHNAYNPGAFIRFTYACELRQKIPLDEFVLIDDDQLWPDNLFSSLVEAKTPMSSTSWYGKVYSKTDRKLIDYFDSDLTMTDIRQHRKAEITAFKYSGPGGSIFDANICLASEALSLLPSSLGEFNRHDDIWISFVMDALLGWRQHRLLSPIPRDVAFDPSSEELFVPSVELQKKVAKVATYVQSKENKREFFYLLQKTYNWNLTSEFSGSHQEV